MMVYFADSNVSPEQLNGLFADETAPEGRLRWVPGFAGLNSSAEVASKSENRIIRVNRALRESASIDSDGDGIVNRQDLFPFDSEAEQVSLTADGLQQDSQTVIFSWLAQGGKRYRVEYTSDLRSPNWQPLTEYSNSSNEPRRAVVQDKIAPGTPRRFYRVRPL
jgi:hypothetical protein